MGLRKQVPFSEEHGIQESVGVHLVQKAVGAAIILPNPGPADCGAISSITVRPRHGTYPRPQTEALLPMEQNSSDSAHFQQVKKASLWTNK